MSKREIIKILEKEITKTEKMFKKAEEFKNYSKMAELDSYKNGIEFSLEVVRLSM